MEEEVYMEEEVEMMEEEPLEACPICNSEIEQGQRTIDCEWCGTALHEDCEHSQEKCPVCKRYLPSAKQKALSSDRRATAVLVTIPFVIIEVIIALFSWMNHPSSISVPDLDNWFSMGLIVNVILLIAALITMGAVARRGEGVQKAKMGKAKA
jgi:hypothetical protein